MFMLHVFCFLFFSRWGCVHCGLKKSSDCYLLLRFLEHCACACHVLLISRNRLPSIIIMKKFHLQSDCSALCLRMRTLPSVSWAIPRWTT